MIDPATPELEWIAANMPDEAAAVRFADHALSLHTDWDSLHSFTLLTWDGTALYPSMIAVIDTSIHPDQYPDMLRGLLVESLARRFREEPKSDPVVACMLQIEAYGITAGPSGMIAEEREAFARREAHTLPHRFECAIVYLADISGRVWSATKIRGDGGPDEVRAASEGAAPEYGKFPTAVRASAALIPALYVGAARSFWLRGTDR